MSKAYSNEMAVAAIIQKISDNEMGAQLSKEADQLGVELNSIKRRFKEAVDKFYKDDIYYDDKDYHWKAHRHKFIEATLIDAEEAVILSGIRRNANHYGYGLKDKVHTIINNYVKRRHLRLLQKDSIELTDENMLDTFALIKNAERRGQYLSFMYDDQLCKAVPLQIVNLEYYWYFYGDEVDVRKTIWPFTVAKMSDIIITDEPFDRNVRKKTIRKLKGVEHGMNAFYRPFGEIKNTVELLVPEDFNTYLERAPYFSIWNFTGRKMTIEGESYLIYTIVSTNKDYLDVLPTIQKYMHKIVVRNIPANQNLIDKMRKTSKDYAKIFSKSS